MRKGLLVPVGVVVAVLLAACTTEPATNVTRSAATLNGTGQTAGKAIAYTFQYATDEDDLGTARDTETPVAATLPPGTDELTPFALRVTTLQPKTDYVYRTCARVQGDTGQTCFFPSRFTTGSPLCDGDGTTCTTEPADVRSGLRAVFRATHFATGVPMTRWFEYRRSIDGERFATPRVGPSALADGTFSATVTDLVPESGYYAFRACAQAAGDARPTCAPERSFVAPDRLCHDLNDDCGAVVVTAPTSTGATFGAAGFTSDGPLLHWFSVTEAESHEVVLATPARGPEVLGADGSFSERTTALRPDSSYLVRACVSTPDGGFTQCSSVATPFETTGGGTDLCGRGEAAHCTATTTGVTATTATIGVSGLGGKQVYRAWFAVSAGVEAEVRTPEQDLKAGQSTITAALTGLEARRTAYTFRFCVRASDGVESCPVSGTFTTLSGPAPDYPHVGGRVIVKAPVYYGLDVDVQADAGGGDPRGRVTADQHFPASWPDTRPHLVGATPTCVNVVREGDRRQATVNVVLGGRTISLFLTEFVYEDGTQYQYADWYDAGREPGDCSAEAGDPANDYLYLSGSDQLLLTLSGG